MGYTLSRQELYLHLIPRQSDSTHRRTHVRTVPVQLWRVKSNKRNRHADSEFTFTTRRQLKNMVSYFGEKCGFAISMYDKAKAPISIRDATKQARIVIKCPM